ncbi:hypothetical protein ACP70R_045250 [Stipagrostis hirtigluma subsp. patula]
MDTGDSYNFSGWIIGGHGNDYTGAHQVIITGSKQQPPVKRGGFPQPAGAVSYAYSSYTPHKYHYPPPPYPYQMAGAGYKGGYHGQGGYGIYGHDYNHRGARMNTVFPPVGAAAGGAAYGHGGAHLNMGMPAGGASAAAAVSGNAQHGVRG